MHAWQVTAHSTPPSIAELPDPNPGPGQIALEIAACGLNFADLLMIEGKYQDTPALPFVPGLELAGTVTACGPGVAHLAPGTRVSVYSGSGGLATRGVFDAARAVALPEDMPLTEAAGFQIAYGTSHLALTRRANMQEGETLLVLGAAGGVGLTAVEVGAALGARVIACARGEAKLETARAAGASELIDTGSTDGDALKARLRELGGVDVVYDPVGGDLFRPALSACKPEARYLAIGFASGTVPQIPANHLLVKNVSVIGFYWGGYMSFAPEALTGSLEALFQLYREGRLKPHVSQVLPFSRALEGLDLLRRRAATGKVVIAMEGA